MVPSKDAPSTHGSARTAASTASVSYTHLDVYKRQVVWRPDGSGGEVFELATGADSTALLRGRFDRLDDGPAELDREVRAAVAAAGGLAERKEP